ncbi:DNA ligase [Pseudomonas phage Henninger]|uniref:DNA ligase n=1 Tax=Pseudomonas phage Henninger TaxID=2079287 RepID=A0A2K9VH94_9CAUD|nr:DNA ligase [Pseudomonas phage Henninger]AUV61721.1 DNA ligase [Pseudomonas phage Henninger]
MSKVERVILSTKPFRPTDYNEKAMTAVLDESYLIADVKKDGVRLNLCVDLVETKHDHGWAVEWLSREGKRFPAFGESHGPLDMDPRWSRFFNPNLGEALFPEGFMLDAELIILKDGLEVPCKTTSGTLRRKSEKPELSTLRVYVFDIVPMDVVQSGAEYEVMQCVRKGHVEYQVAKLKEAFPEIDWRVAETYEVYSMETLPVVEREGFDEEGNEITVKLQPPLSLSHLYATVRERGEEGLVCKDPMGYYRRSKVSGWWKMVPDDNEDGIIQGPIWGTAGLANEGKVIGFKVLLESGHVVNACKISRKLMDEFTAAYKQWEAEQSPPECVTPEPYFGWTAKVTFMERYPDGSLRHPSFDSFRGISNPLIKE